MRYNFWRKYARILYIFKKWLKNPKNRKIKLKYFHSKLYRDMISSSSNHFDHIFIFEILKIRPSTILIGEKVAENRVKLFSVKVFKDVV